MFATLAKIWRTLARWIGSVVLFFALLSIFIIVAKSAMTWLKTVESFRIYKSVPASAVLDPSRLAQVQSAILDISPANEDSGARAYRFPGSNYYLTNHHVLNIICLSTGCPEEMNVSFYNELKFRKVRIKPLRCSQWLDVCAFAEVGQPIGKPSFDKNPNSPTEKVLTLANRHFEYEGATLVKQGAVSGRIGPFLEVELDSRKGYSGSPLFDKDGHFVGILTGVHLVRALEKGFFEWLRVMLGTGDLFEGVSNVIDADAIRSTLLCPELTPHSDCTENALLLFSESWLRFSERITQTRLPMFSKPIIRGLFFEVFLKDLENHSFEGVPKSANTELPRIVHLICDGAFESLSEPLIREAASTPGRWMLLAHSAIIAKTNGSRRILDLLEGMKPLPPEQLAFMARVRKLSASTQ